MRTYELRGHVGRIGFTPPERTRGPTPGPTPGKSARAAGEARAR